MAIYGESEPMMGESISESSGNEIENRFVDEICDLVIESLSINYNERRIVKPLLRNSITNKLNNRWGNNGRSVGLLQQYEKYILDTATQRLIDDLELGEEVKVNHDYHTSSKLSDIIKSIKVKYSIKDQRKEKIQQLGSSPGKSI